MSWLSGSNASRAANSSYARRSISGAAAGASPSRPLTGLFRWTKESGRRERPVKRVRGLDWSYPYMLMHSYSINRLARLLADAGVVEWHARWHETVAEGRSNETVTIFFRKD